MSNPLVADLDHILDHTRSLWGELRGERLFITGGTGFFGCWFLESFTWAVERLGLNSAVTVLTREPEAFAQKVPHLANHPAVTLHCGDVRSFSFPDGTYSHIIHAATAASARMIDEQPNLMLQTIVGGTARTLEFAQQCGASKLLLTSSGAVYGKQPPDMERIPETYAGAPDPLDHRSCYGEGKRMAEHLCALAARSSKLQVKIARCFAFVGPYLPLNLHYAIGNFIRDAVNGGPIRVNGDGTPLRSYLYASDLMIWLWTLLFRSASLKPYNVGSEAALSISAIASEVAGLQEPVPDILMSASAGKSEAHRYIPSTLCARGDLALSETVPLCTSLVKTISWYRSRPSASH